MTEIGEAAEETLATRLRHLRTVQGLERSDIASGPLTTRRVYAIENGARPTATETRILANQLYCHPLYLSHGIGEGELDAVHHGVAAAGDALYRGRPDEAVRRFERVFADPELAPILTLLPELHRSTVSEYTMALEAAGDFPRAITRLTDLAQQTIPGERAWGEYRSALVRCHRRDGDIGAAIDAGEGALADLADRRDLWGPPGIMVATELLPAYVAAGDQASGERLISELMSRTGLNEEPAIRFGVHWHIVEAAGAWGNSERALRHAADAFTIALKNEVADPRRLGNSYAQLLLNTGQPPAAREARRTLGLPDLEWENAPADVLAARQVLRARASRILGQPERAIQELEPVLGRGAQPTPPGTHGRAFAELGRAYSTLGREREAAHAIRQAIPLLAQGGLDDEAEAVQADLARVTAGGDFPQTSVTARTNIKEASSRRPPQPRQTRRGGPRRG